jgi:hypothetical protein
MRSEDAKQVIQDCMVMLINKHGGELEDWRLDCYMFLLSQNLPVLDQALHTLNVSFTFLDEETYLNREVLKA